MESEELTDMLVPERRRSRFREVLAQRLGCLDLVCDHVLDDRNLSACYRCADAFAVPRIWELCGESPQGTLHNAITMKTHQWVEREVCRDPEALCGRLRSEGFSLVGAVVGDTPGAVPYRDLSLPDRIALVVGSERVGISDAMRERCDELVTIPTYGFVESLNLSTAAAILLNHLAAAYAARGGDIRLSAERQQALFETWCDREVRRKLRGRPRPT